MISTAYTSVRLMSGAEDVGIWFNFGVIVNRLAVTPLMLSEPIVCELETVQDVPEPSVIVVPGMSWPVVSNSVCPMAIVPLATAETVRAVPDMLPVKTAPGAFGEPISTLTGCAHEA